MSDSATSWDFFIIHSSADAAPAEELYHLLSPPHRVFLDRKVIELADDWMRTLDAALRQSRVFVVLISPNLEGAHFAREEINTAINFWRRDPQRRKVVPVLLAPRGQVDMPYGLGIIQGAELGADGGMAGVAARLRGLIGDAAGDGPRPLPPPGKSAPPPPAHPLHDYPAAADIPAHKVPTRNLAAAYAKRISHTDALHVVDEANAFRMEADPGDHNGVCIDTAAVPPPGPNAQGDFWKAVFYEARKLGPRMLAALLLTVDASHFEQQAKNDRQALLDYLRSLPQ